MGSFRRPGLLGNEGMDKKMETTIHYSGLWIWNCGFGVVVLQTDFPMFIQKFGCPSRSQLAQTALADQMARAMAQQVVPDLCYFVAWGLPIIMCTVLGIFIVRITLY